MNERKTSKEIDQEIQLQRNRFVFSFITEPLLTKIRELKNAIRYELEHDGSSPFIDHIIHYDVALKYQILVSLWALDNDGHEEKYFDPIQRDNRNYYGGIFISDSIKQKLISDADYYKQKHVEEVRKSKESEVQETTPEKEKSYIPRGESVAVLEAERQKIRQDADKKVNAILSDARREAEEIQRKAKEEFEDANPLIEKTGQTNGEHIPEENNPDDGKGKSQQENLPEKIQAEGHKSQEEIEQIMTSLCKDTGSMLTSYEESVKDQLERVTASLNEKFSSIRHLIDENRKAPLKDFYRKLTEVTENAQKENSSHPREWLIQFHQDITELLHMLERAVNAFGIDIYAPERGEEYDEDRQTPSNDHIPEDPVVYRCEQPGFTDHKSGDIMDEGRRTAQVYLVDKSILAGVGKKHDDTASKGCDGVVE